MSAKRPWIRPTEARIWITGIAAFHFSPKTTWTNSGATAISPSIDGTMISATIRVARVHIAAIRAGSLTRENAGKKTCAIGVAILVAGMITTE